MTFSSLRRYVDGFHLKCVEPMKRLYDTYGWKSHRFAIKRGISLRDAMLEDALEESVLFVEGLKVTFRGIPVRVDAGSFVTRET